MHEIERVAEESTSGSEDGQRAHRGDKHLLWRRFNASTVHITEG
jgi:hypothetical protein